MTDQRPVTISTACLELPDPDRDGPRVTKAGNLKKALRMIEEAGRRASDLVVLPELFATKHTPLSPSEAAEPVPEGDISQALAAAARGNGMYIAGCLYEQLAERIYNTVALFDRGGELVGKYHKVHLPEGEDEVATPGDGYPVFETDFGRLGALVCFDLNFPEAARSLALDGAEIIMWPTMWSQPRAHYTDAILRARAIENKVFLVAANYAQRGMDPAAVHIGRSAIVDWDGMVLADTGRREGLATATVDLGESREVFGWPADLLSRRLPATYTRILE